MMRIGDEKCDSPGAPAIDTERHRDYLRTRRALAHATLMGTVSSAVAIQRPPAKACRGGREPVVEVRNLVQRFGDFTVVDRVSFDVVRRPNAVRRNIGLVFLDQTLDDRLTEQENLRFHVVLYRVPTEQGDARIALAIRGCSRTE